MTGTNRQVPPGADGAGELTQLKTGEPGWHPAHRTIR